VVQDFRFHSHDVGRLTLLADLFMVPEAGGRQSGSQRQTAGWRHRPGPLR
jgi:hypothetical protein